ncbi:sensor histidine kinase [Gracilinema caldarium]|uniref:histidine kinase n=1 Tax=Gracilinema caldarium (strain ATCC 51460 / DSM 7334 / H1) TaxID=744872 RepID=F8F3R3_GRAC1|nr:sensor histidine kinase [Gracilinema caldarium]AEJ20432.1 integral membrane sensor signal transduction histidine kinase [Gracilinema caldarium DSM 7334]
MSIQTFRPLQTEDIENTLMNAGEHSKKHHILRRLHTNSIRKTLRVTNIVIIIATLVPFLISNLYYNIILNQYQNIIKNVYSANNLSSHLQDEMYTTIWNVVSGKTKFEDNSQYQLMNNIRDRLNELEKNATSEDNSYLIRVARNTLDTIEGYINKIGENIIAGQPVRENERLLEEIRSVSELLYDVIQKFIAAEMEIAHIQNTKIQRSLELMTVFQMILFTSILAFLIINYKKLNRSINIPIYRLKTMASQIAKGDLSIRVEKPEISELDDLTDSLNTMAEKLGMLIAQNIQKQQNLQKAEMKALQAQITPHFMYNTLDTILALAEAGQNKDVVTTTLALSNFFRLSLNKGRDWVSVGEEISHVESYLSIQKMRYGPILDYEIDIDKTMLKEPMLKILLQPLIENAIYHGIKKTRRPGLIIVHGSLQTDHLMFVIEDNGLGMEESTLEHLRQNLSHYDVSNPESGFGLYNVYKRIQLYYGTNEGLSIESQYNKGTRVTLRLPIITDSNNMQTPL